MNNLEKQTILINGKAYDWSTVNVSIGTSLLFGITEVSYTETQDVKPIYNDNVYALGYGKGKISVSGSLTVELEELRILLHASNDKDIYNLPPFPITISFVDDFENLPFTYIIYNCKFINNKMSTVQNDTNIYSKIDFISSHILKIPTTQFKFGDTLKMRGKIIDIYRR